MPSLLETIDKLNLPKVDPPAIPARVIALADRLGVVVTLTCPLAPEEYSVTKDGQPSGYIRVRWGGMSVEFPDASDEVLCQGSVDGFGGFTDQEREPRLLFALSMIAARMLKA